MKPWRKLSDIHQIYITNTAFNWVVMIETKSGSRWRVMLSRAESPLPTDDVAKALWLNSQAWKQI